MALGGSERYVRISMAVGVFVTFRSERILWKTPAMSGRMALKSGGGRWSVIARAGREDLGASPVTVSRVLLSVADGEEHHQNARDDDANQVVEAHHRTPRDPARPQRYHNSRGVGGALGSEST